MSAKTTTPVLVIKPWQYTAETTEGTTPTASPSFTGVAAETVSFGIDGNFEDAAQIGTEDMLAIIQGPQRYDSSVKFYLANSTYLKYGVNAANYASPSGTISETLSHLFSIYLNGTENYVILKGSRAKSATIDLEIGRPTVASIDWVHTTITAPATSHGLTTPTLASVPTSAIWTWTSGGATPVSWNASGIKCQKISISINRNTAVDHTLGNLDPYSSQPHARNISGSMTVLWTNTDLETDFRAGTSRTLAVVLKSATSTLTLTNCVITSYKRTDLKAGGDSIKEEVEFKATAVTVS